ncbi:MAG: SDR family oxidoreductase [Candidatus Amesbacteria bacterium]|nr:SDR family oxidoreductase [Candidatus Amesbacteria bacterium]
MDLQNKVVVITGGCQGFGKALAKAFVKSNSKVIISSNVKLSLSVAASELNIDSFLSDVTKPEELSVLGEYAVKKYGHIDIWINNAGIQIAPSPVENVDVQKLRRLFDINFFGYYYGCQTAISIMKGQNTGLIININSTAGLDGKSGLSAYSSSKFAIKGLTESIRKELAETNVKIYGVYPGGMQTDIYKEKYPSDISEYMLVDDVANKVITNLKSDIPEHDQIIKRPSK